MRSRIVRWLCYIVALLVVGGLCALPSTAGELTRDELAAKFSPPFSLGERDGSLPIYPVFRNEGSGDRLAGYVFESVDLTPIPGFSGTPPNLLIVLDADGTFQRVEVIAQHEPVFVHGLGPEPLDQFVEQYAGKTLVQNVKVGPPRASGRVRDGTNVTIDGVAKATASVHIVNESVLAAALAVARAKLGVGGAAKVAASVRPIIEPMDFGGLDRAGLVQRLVLEESDVEAAFAGTVGEGGDPIALRAPDAIFADMHVAYLNIPSVGESLFGKADWARIHERLDGGHAILVSVGGRHRPFDEPYVFGATPDNFSLTQDGLALDIKDLSVMHDVLKRPLLPRDAPGAPFVILKVFGKAGFDPASPWRLSLRVTREKGQFWPERATHDFGVDVNLPERWFEKPSATSPATTGWQSVWHDRASDLYLLGVGLALLVAVLAGQPATARRPHLFAAFRVAFLTYTLVVVGWFLQAQLSIVTLAGLVKAAFVTRDIGFLLWDPPSLVLWAVVVLAAIVWGRGTFCGWLCPFGALQELLATLTAWMNLPQLRVPDRLDQWLKRLKYVVLAGFLALALLWPAIAEVAAEVEPFKTAITMVFQRTWPAVTWAMLLLLANLFVYKAFCRYLCPLGAFIALIGRARRFDWIARRAECGSPCRLCKSKCRYGAIDRTGAVDYSECFQCMDCVTIHQDRKTCVPLILAGRNATKKDDHNATARELISA